MLPGRVLIHVHEQRDKSLYYGLSTKDRAVNCTVMVISIPFQARSNIAHPGDTFIHRDTIVSESNENAG